MAWTGMMTATIGYWRYYPPSRPLPAKGGIKARSQRGGFAESGGASDG